MGNTGLYLYYREVGIVYGAPDTVDPMDVLDKRDAVEIHKRGVQKIIDNADNVIPMHIARKPKVVIEGKTKRVSVTVAERHLERIKRRLVIPTDD